MNQLYDMIEVNIMQKIKEQEKIIRNAIRNGDLITIIAVEKALERFSDEDILLGGKKGAIFRSIYYGKPQENWKLSVAGFVGERTLFRYRNDYLVWIFFYKSKAIKNGIY